ncbi:hypothetical protein EYZ11_012826 [Aspergillus tanneri]|uniref:Uncharacterized protein n=1 Tax=Aspergillus tanneri TaxID=1220188 RepID=A0A4S3J1D5_9EURO|nr:hypothetical protein EYZ11_012826 [Aspergillus tanneri]
MASALLKRQVVEQRIPFLLSIRRSSSGRSSYGIGGGRYEGGAPRTAAGMRF